MLQVITHEPNAAIQLAPPLPTVVSPEHLDIASFQQHLTVVVVW
jgi:hypothetical protein